MKALTGARRTWTGLLCAVVLAQAGGPAKAAPPEPDFVLRVSDLFPDDSPIPDFEGPCGLAVDSDGNFYVADYYHDVIDVFSATPGFKAVLEDTAPLGGPCGLALDGASNLYVNNFHRNVAKFGPSPSFAPGPIVDSSDPTGVAVDPVTGNVYVNARTYIAAYDSSGAPLLDGGGEPLRIGLGTLEDGYGLALSGFAATSGRLYVADADAGTVKAYNSNPALDVVNPVATIGGPGDGFVSLVDSALAIDDATGELFVADNRQPLHTERPEAVIYVYGAAGFFEGRLKYGIVDALPPGLAVDNSGGPTQGRAYVTSGNTAGAVVYAYPPGSATSAAVPVGSSPANLGSGASGALVSAAAPNPSGDAGAAAAPSAPAATTSVAAQKGNLRVSVAGKLSPQRLPRRGVAPIAVSVKGEITTTDSSLPPQLETLEIELNRHGRIDRAGLPTCLYDRIQPASGSRALSACRPALVGRGSFTANITLAGQEPYPTQGRLLVFNGIRDGKPVLFGHIYSARPFATSFVIVFSVHGRGKGAYGTALRASLPPAMDAWGRLTGLEMTLSRRYSHGGRRHSYFSAGCPAPKGFPGAVFPLLRTRFGFDGGIELSSVLTGSCKARG